MPYLKNPYGKIVAVDDPKRYQQWLTTTGYRAATEEEVLNFITEREELYKKLNTPPEQLQPSSIDGVYFITVSGGGKDGYGVASQKLFKELKDLGVNISVSFEEQKIGLLFHNPYSIMKMENPYRIIYTMFESTKLPDDWTPFLEAADKVLVPSKFCQKTFSGSGISSDIINLGYDDKVYTYHQRPNKRKERGNFVFLHYNAYNIRKGFLEVVKAFTKEFSRDEPVKMIFKTNLSKIPIPFNPNEYPNIEVINESLPERELNKLCQRADCFVFPSRGEGFGITPLEAMATGLPTIVPNAHGIAEYFNGDYMYEVKIASECPALYSRYKGQNVGKMVVCDVDDLRAQMRYVYEHQDEALAKGKLASEYVKQWTFHNTALKLKALFDQIYRLPLKDKPLRNVLELEQVK